MTGAVLGIAVSLVPILLVYTVSDGMIEGITNRYVETKTYHIQAALPDNFGETEAKSLTDALTGSGGITYASEEVDLPAVAVSASGSQAVLIRAVSPEYFTEPGVKRYLSIREGETEKLGSKGIILGTALADSLAVKPGDTVTIVAPERTEGSGSDSRFGYSPRLFFFRVKAVADAGYRDLDSIWAFVDRQSNSRLLDTPVAYRFMGFKVDDPYSNSLGEAIGLIGAEMEQRHPEWYDSGLVRPWPELERNLYRSFGSTKSTLLLIMTIALLVAALNLGSALSTFVSERTQDIAILKSFGISPRSIASIFVFSGLLTGLSGTLLGLASGIAVSANVNAIVAVIERLVNAIARAGAFLGGRSAIPARLLDPEYYLESIPVSLDPNALLALGLASVLLAFAVSYFPARTASRIPVQDLMRKR